MMQGPPAPGTSGSAAAQPAESDNPTEGRIWRNYRPSNGTEGDYFMAQTCYRCERDHQWHDGNDNGDSCCPILLSSMVGEYSYSQSEYGPPEWSYDPDSGEGWCDAFLGPCECDWQRDAMTITYTKPDLPHLPAAYRATITSHPAPTLPRHRRPPRPPPGQLRLDL